MKNQTPYDGTMIFKRVTPLADLLIEIEAIRQDKKDPLAKFYADASVYKQMYAEALERLSRPDMLTLDDAAARLGLTPAAYVKMAETGQALLIEIEGRQVVPDCIFGKDGKIDPLKLDIAREFVLEGQSYFKFLDYLKFMTSETVNIAAILPKKKLSALFKAAGMEGYNCTLTVNATMNQLADRRDRQPTFFDSLVKKLDDALTSGGWDASGGLSRPFRDKYNIPGLTIDEDRRGVMPPQKKKQNKKDI